MRLLENSSLLAVFLIPEEDEFPIAHSLSFPLFHSPTPRSFCLSLSLLSRVTCKEHRDEALCPR